MYTKMSISEFYQYIQPNSNNIANTNTEFIFEFPSPVHLDTEFECAILESYIPHTQYNISEDQYFVIEEYASNEYITGIDANKSRGNRRNPLWRHVKKMFQSNQMNG